MKKILLPLFLLSGFAAGAQDLALKIPKDADVVLSVKGDHFLDLVTVKEFEKSVLGKELVKELADGKKDQKKGIEDLGLKLTGTMYYYNEIKDSITYHCFLLPLSDARKFESFLHQRMKGTSETRGDVRRLYPAGEEGVILQWNSEYACFISGNLNTRFIKGDSVMSARYGLKEVSISDYTYDRETEADDRDVIVAAPVELSDDYNGADVAHAVAPPPPPPPESMADTIVRAEAAPARVEEASSEDSDKLLYPPVIVAQAQADTTYVEEATKPYEDTDDAGTGVVEAVPMPPTETTDDAYMVMAPPETRSNYSYNNEAYLKAYDAQNKIKQELTRQWTDQWLSATTAITDVNNSILSNRSYQQSLDKAAAASFYLADMQRLTGGLMSYYYRPRMPFGSYLEGYHGVSGRLYLSGDQMKMVADMELDEKRLASFKKIYHHKLNSKFADYVNMDKTVGFIAASVDAEAYLKELPSWFDNQYYGRVLGFRGDEVGIAAELFSLLLDEKAVAKVIKGDALFLVTDVGPKQYTYTSYEYDEDNYERKEVAKTKTETLPELLFMMSSDDTRLLQRLLAYGMSRGLVSLSNGIYTLERKTFGRRSPFDFHLLIKDGIVFCGTSLKDIRDISTGTFRSNISKEQRKMLLNSNMTAFFKPANLAGKISSKEFGSSKDLRIFNAFMENAGDMYIRSLGFKKNRVATELVAEVPKGNRNSLQYFLSLIDKTAQPGLGDPEEE